MVSETRAAPSTLGGVDLGSPHLRRGLLFCFWEGLLSSGMLALNDTFAVAAAVSLQASPMAISLIGALPLALGYAALYLAPALADPARGRKHYTVLGVRAQACLLLLCAFAGWLPQALAAPAFISVFVVALVCSHATGAFWVAWMGDLIPPAVRGRHWAWRTTYFSWMNLACALGAGFLARHYHAENAPWLFFCGVFAAASGFRFLALEFLRRQYEPPATKPLEVFSPLRFRPERRFLAFSLSSAAFQGTAVMTAPFFTVWFLRDLKFNYFWLSLATSAGVLGSIALVRFWGRLADRLGTHRVLRIAGLLSAFNPLPFLFLDSPAAICLASFATGGLWAGYGLAAFNHVLAMTENGQRHHYIAFHSLMAGMMGGLFGLAGGFLATRLPVLFGWELRSLFLLSAALRFGLWAAYLRAVPKAG
jgi:MFS family permease